MQVRVVSSPLGDVAVQVGAGAAFLFTSWQSFRANKQTKATGNGFAKHVKESLDRIEGKIDRHIEDHAEADLRRHN